MKRVTKIATVLYLAMLTACSSIETNVDQTPMPVDGMVGIMKNVKYPDEARIAGVQGKVFVKATINTDGKVVNAEIVKSDSEKLNEASLRAIAKTKFNAGIKDGEKVVAEVTIPIMFQLKDKS